MTSTAISLKEFYAVGDTAYTQRDAEVIGPVIASISEEGVATPRSLLNAGRSQASPIHSYFEWNNDVAADLWRLEQAKGMLRSIKIKTIERGPEKEDRRELTSKPETREARPMRVVSNETSQAAEVALAAYEEILKWKRKYESSTKAFKRVSDAIGAVVNQIGECEDVVNLDGIPFKTDQAMLELLVWRAKHGASATTWAAWTEQMDFIMQAVGEADEELCRPVDTSLKTNCVQCGKEFTPKHERHRLCESC